MSYGDLKVRGAGGHGDGEVGDNLATYTSPIWGSAFRQRITCDERPVVAGKRPICCSRPATPFEF